MRILLLALLFAPVSLFAQQKTFTDINVCNEEYEYLRIRGLQVALAGLDLQRNYDALADDHALCVSTLNGCRQFEQECQATQIKLRRRVRKLRRKIQRSR